MTASQRTRFDARLEERLRDGVVRRRRWLVAVAAAAAALSLLVWRAGVDVPDGGEVVRVEVGEPALDESETVAEEWILAMATDSLTETDEALPPDYLAISDLLLDN